MFVFIAFRDLPLSILIGIPLVAGCYVLVNIAYLAVLTPAEIKVSSAVAVVSSSNVKPHLPFAIHDKEKPSHLDSILLAANRENEPRGGIRTYRSSLKTKIVIRSKTCPFERGLHCATSGSSSFLATVEQNCKTSCKKKYLV